MQARDIPDQTFGVHSWTHGYSSGQTNEELLGELGWTMQGASDLSSLARDTQNAADLERLSSFSPRRHEWRPYPVLLGASRCSRPASQPVLILFVWKPAAALR